MPKPNECDARPGSPSCRLHRHELGRVLRCGKTYAAVALLAVSAEALRLPGSIAAGEAGLADIGVVVVAFGLQIAIAWARDNSK